MNNSTKKFLPVLLVVAALCLGFVGGAAAERQFSFLKGSIPPAASQNFGLMAEAWNTIEKKYVDREAVQPQRLTYGALSGMVEALGDTGHSTFLSPEMVKQQHNFTQGQFQGIGVEIEAKDGQIVIVAPIDGSPAQKAGLRAGEIILKVNGKEISGLPLEQVVSQVVGPAGTKVTLTIQDPETGAIRDVTIQRAQIQVDNVTWRMLPDTTIAHVRLAGFSNGVTQDLQKTIQEIRDQGGTKMILDLRNDPGGLLGEAIGVTSQFLNSGNVLLEKNAQGEVKPVPVQEGGVATDLPMVVLVNQGTASAAEIVSGALQDAQRAKLVGETTFGTGTVLNEFRLSDGSALLLATEEWLTPKGRVIWHQGIAPDVQVSLPPTATQLVPEGEDNLTKEQLDQSGDQQLLRAIDLLNE